MPETVAAIIATAARAVDAGTEIRRQNLPKVDAVTLEISNATTVRYSSPATKFAAVLVGPPA
jgi:hypothetical protein